MLSWIHPGGALLRRAGPSRGDECVRSPRALCNVHSMGHMRERLLTDLVEAAVRRGASYADARWVERQQESVNVKDGEVEGIDRASDRGVGLRVLDGGSWGFAATDRPGGGDA